MGKIIASFLVKVHLHATDVPEGLVGTTVGEMANDAPTNAEVKAAIIAGLSKELGLTEVTVSHIEQTD